MRLPRLGLGKEQHVNVKTPAKLHPYENHRVFQEHSVGFAYSSKVMRVKKGMHF